MFSYSYDNLKKIVETEQGKAFVATIKKQYDEKYADRPIYALEYSQFKRFYIDGDRTSFQNQYFERRRRLTLLQILALSNDDYLVDLENILSAICEEFCNVSFIDEFDLSCAGRWVFDARYHLFKIYV